MYIISVIALLFVLPAISILIEFASGSVFSPEVAQRWFVFWAVGARLMLAGIRQVSQPNYTAEKILGIKAPEATFVVRELGFANVAIGTVAVLSFFWNEFCLPLALIGTIFYGLAGCNHLLHKNRNRLQNVAMVSDLLVSGILGVLTVLARQ